MQQKITDISFLYGTNAAYIENFYAKYKQDKNSVDENWQNFFASLGDDEKQILQNNITHNINDKQQQEWISAIDGQVDGQIDGQQQTELKNIDAYQATRDSIHAIMMIRAYRMRGHLHANLDPLGLAGKKEAHDELHPSTYGFSEADYERPIFLDGVLGLKYANVREMLEILQRTYCSTLGVEFMHISNPAEKSWIQQRIEGVDKTIDFTVEGKQAILKKLVQAEGFEKFIDVKYKGTKRFGLDGGEAAVAALEQIIKRGGQLGLEEIVLGMPHRGRLNVLANVMGKPFRAIFHEFKGGSANPDDVEGSGDVKYHLGASSDREFDGNTVHLSLTANPSHLEIVNPVVMGKARAKQELLAKAAKQENADRTKVLPLLLHGDAAFAGQGVVAECFGLSGLKGHLSGGTIHLIVNNQIGFTTNPMYSRSSPYPSDVAKMIEAPIFHVNADDPEAVVYAAKVAIEFRQQFAKPVVLDMFCYRRFGHNEGDEPKFTQPIMYDKIANHPSVAQIYNERLKAENIVDEKHLQNLKNEFRTHLDQEFETSENYKPNKADWLDGAWSGLKIADSIEERREGATDCDNKTLAKIGKSLTTIPPDFALHKTLTRFIQHRAKMFESGENIDWATAEALAFGSLQLEGHKIRLSGQDCERGTFSQRHSVLYDQKTQARYIPLNNLEKSETYEVINSMLSEEAVLGYEYGYALADPNALVIWEAQFGDFVNGAQVVIDQFISSGERKWLRMCGLVMLLPHGYEGQGPEHSSARLERFLQSCAEDNMQVANCTTPANYFHILRRQLKRTFRKPLILMTPKSLLRHKNCVSNLAELSTGSSFHRILWDDAQYKKQEKIKLCPDNKIRKAILCSGKIYYDLYKKREDENINDVYILRIEQLYPFPNKAAIKELTRFKNAEIIWCQEEPKNMGGWSFVEPHIEDVLGKIKAKHKRAKYIGRAASASTATGQLSKHIAQLEKLLHEAIK